MFNPLKHHRRSIRLPGYDYTQPGAYFITMVTQNRELLFGDVLDGEMRLNEYGVIADKTWQWLATQYPYMVVDAWVTMPNHVHCILMIQHVEGSGGSRPAATKPLAN